MIYYYIYHTKIGDLLLKSREETITHILFCDENEYIEKNFEEKRETPIIQEAYQQLLEYFSGTRTKFELSISPEGTEFQKKVWNALRDIPYGETRSYKEIATFIGNEKASRAVGNANNKNPIPIIIPCHRVIGANGKLVGYAGGLDKKKKLLDIEAI
ncbi:methylated-DNA--protein-cysteine methyltransferase [Anaeromicropila herbilytica]|uniref:Methylated-DNA--protein-cysteine methyltransferase n=1 Tax=Anaeromicropila herbilytica TaxID=2785025 RepID=A0A7R7ELY7_9FIRM|nr:methylated-DNA--protein-cysteine methyltransferase [Anaeromicropila herbilytica]